MRDRLGRLMSGSDWRRADAPFMERLAFQCGRVAFWACVPFGLLSAIIEWHWILVVPFGLFFWWFVVMTARVTQELQDVRRSS